MTEQFMTEQSKRIQELESVNRDLLKALESAREELREYELDRTGEDYNNTTINAAIARARGQ